MEENLKSRVIFILALLSLIFFLVTMASCGSLFRYKKAKDKETAARFDLEERVNKLTQEKTLAESKLNSLSEELKKERTALEQAELVSQSLKEELDKVTKLKEKLEEDLKEALVAVKSAKAKMH
jgi:multidrug resistance efflux pump